MTNEEAYRKYAPELLRFASGLAAPVDAQDIVTDACLRSFRAKRWPERTISIIDLDCLECTETIQADGSAEWFDLVGTP